jgi:hypothetical protein
MGRGDPGRGWKAWRWGSPVLVLRGGVCHLAGQGVHRGTGTWLPSDQASSDLDMQMGAAAPSRGHILLLKLTLLKTWLKFLLGDHPESSAGLETTVKRGHPPGSLHLAGLTGELPHSSKHSRNVLWD